MRAQPIAVAVPLLVAALLGSSTQADAPDPRMVAPFPRIVDVGGTMQAVLESGYRDYVFSPAVVAPGAAAGSPTPSGLLAAVAATSAEAEAERAVGAMARGDFEGWLALWEPEARAQHRQRQGEAGFRPEDWIRQWATAIGPGPQRFVARFDYGAFALIVYQPDRWPARTPGGVPIVLRRQADGTWRLSQGLAKSGLVGALMRLVNHPGGARAAPR